MDNKKAMRVAQIKTQIKELEMELEKLMGNEKQEPMPMMPQEQGMM